MRKTNCIINGIVYYQRWATVNGKRELVRGDSESDWIRKVDKLKEDATLGLISTNFSLAKCMDSWIYTCLASNPSIKESTFSIHEGVYRNKIAPSSFAKLKLKDIRSVQVQTFLNNLTSQGATPYSVQSARKILRMFFAYAISESYILKNPCYNAHTPSLPIKHEIKVFSDSDIEKIKTSLIGDRNRFIVMLDLATGMRQGELLALKHSDMGKPTLKITKAQSTIRHIEKGQKIRYEIVDTPPKTKAGYREIPLPDSVKKEYEIHKKLCQEEKLARGLGKLIESDYLFYSKNRLRCQPSKLRESWKEILSRANIEFKTFHSLRHTYITKLVQNGVNIYTVMQLAGHEKIETTLRYTHIEMEHKEKVLDIIDSMIK
jgi:site-specific recombinase XerD